MKFRWSNGAGREAEFSIKSSTWMLATTLDTEAGIVFSLSTQEHEIELGRASTLRTWRECLSASLRYYQWSSRLHDQAHRVYMSRTDEEAGYTVLC